MKSLNEIKALTHEQLIVAYWDLQKYEGLIKELREYIETKKLPATVIIHETEGFIYGDAGVLINNLLTTIEFICQQNNIKFESILTEAISKLNESKSC